jgi:hypothetical protein
MFPSDSACLTRMMRRGRMRWSRGVAPLHALRNKYKTWVREINTCMHTIVAVKSLFKDDEVMIQCDTDLHCTDHLANGNKPACTHC